MTATGSVSLGSELKVPLVAKMDVQVTASLAVSKTAAYGSTTTISIPNGRTGHCSHGIYTYRGTFRRTISAGGTSKVSTIYVTAPATSQWRNWVS